MTTATIGIDVSNTHLDVAIDRPEANPAHRQFAYTAAGQQALQGWLEQQGVGGAVVWLEATGHYSQDIAHRLYQAGYAVRMENPARTRHFARSLITRQKNDKVDAVMLARYARVMARPVWTPPQPVMSSLQELQRLVEDLQGDRTRIGNRLEGLRPGSPARPHLERQLAQVEQHLRQVEAELQQMLDDSDTLQQQCALLTTIIGVGRTTALALLAEVVDWSRFPSADALVAYAGINPSQRQSGQHSGYSAISKQGNAHLRRILYFPALSAMQHNPHLKVFAHRLKAAGKPNMAVVVAVMRKLLILAYAILKSGQPYDPLYPVPA